MGATIDEIIDSLKRGQGKRVSDLVKMALEEGTNPQTILEEGFLSGMEQVAEKFRKEEVGVPEILSVTRALDRGVSTLRHYSVGRAKKEIGTVIIGTVKGDLHDIGKNLVKIMMESKNIRVIDLGVDVSPRRFLEEAVGSHAQIVCLSGIMPHSEEDMRAVVEEFEMKVPFAQAKEIVKNNGDTVIRKLCNNDPENITAKTVFEAAVLQDEIAMRLIDQAAKYIGIALATAINMLDPDTIYLCGGMMKNGDDFLNRIKKYTRERQMHLAGRHVAIRPGSKDELNVAKGATLMIQDSGWEFEALSFLY